jgi:hypothetical protein
MKPVSRNFVRVLVVVGILFAGSCNDDDSKENPIPKNFTLTGFTVDGRAYNATVPNTSITPEITLTFSEPIDHGSAHQAIVLSTPTGNIDLNISFSNGDSTLNLSPVNDLNYFSTYTFFIEPELESVTNKILGSTTSSRLITQIDPTPKFPLLADEDDDDDNTNDLLSVIQHKTFKYFYDFAHPASGMARERNTSGNTVTSGGSGFGIMALIVGMERKFITQQEGVDHMNKIVTFLEGADKFHGAWSHWINGNTGDVIPFSPNDNGGDLVETAFLVEGLITFRQYLTTQSIPDTHNLVSRINALWQAVEWDWYRQNDQQAMYWHWSPNKNWVMNHQIKGWNECLITYVLAASAPAENTIPKSVYDAGWASNGGMENGNVYEGITLPLGFPWGGPLFFTHYSFLGLDPRGLNDQYANYWDQNLSHSLINYRYCVRNPKNYSGYGENCWGLTASDNNINGYSAHSPTNDLGVISPTAALSSFPYTPEESMRAAKFFYYTLGDKLWGDYGFYDAFNLNQAWIADSYLAIDQGPIIVMIENYRTGLLWNLFMSSPEVQTGLDKLGFTY